MSYSFSATGATKEAALADAAVKLDVIIQSQPVHAQDREAALDNVRTHLALLAAPRDNELVVVSMHGSISVQTNEDPLGRITNVGSGCSVYCTQIAG